MAETAIALPDPYVRWLDAVATDPANAGDAPPIAELIDALAVQDPRLRAVASLLATRGESAAEDAAADREPDAIDLLDVIEVDPDRAERRAHVQRLLRELVDELAELRSRNETLAAALGACPACWGEVRRCDRCGGGGAPGSDLVDLHLFRLWVAPAVAEIRRRRGVRSVPTGGQKDE